LLQQSCPHFAGDPPKVCCPLLQHSCPHFAGDPPSVCCLLQQHSCPHFDGDPHPQRVLFIAAAFMFSLCWGPSQCVLSIVAAFTYCARDPPTVCCPLLQQSHLDSVTYSGTDNYVYVVFDKPQKRTLMVEAFSHAAPNF
jgi:hypothetical protein